MFRRRFTPLAGLFLLGCLTRLTAADHVLTVATPKGKPIADAVVSLVPLDGPPPPATPAADLMIAQRDSEFTPVVSAVRVGATVHFPNKDKIKHHVYSVSAAKRFDVPLHGGDEAPAIVLDQPGVVSVGCNIHDWMRSYVVVLDTPWFALTGPDGTARLSAPAGRYRREVWHAVLAAPRVDEITLADAAPLTETAPLTLRRDRRPVRPEEGGGTYP